MKELFKKLMNTTFYFTYHKEEFEKGTPFYDVMPCDPVNNLYCGFNENIRHFDFSVAINDYSVDNASELENFLKLKDSINSIFSRLLTTIKNNELFLVTEDHSNIVSLLKNHVENYCIIKVDGIFEEYTLTSHNSLCIIPNDFKKYIRDNSYYQYVISEYLILQKQLIQAILFELNSYIPPQIEKEMPKMKWHGTDTDLLELIVALLETESLRNMDDRKLSRKEAVKLFEEIFSFQIKDPESKLSRATERKMNYSPFLTALKEAFDKYCRNKSEKIK